MGRMSVDLGKIIALLEEAVKIKDKLTDEIQKEKDAKKRKILFEASQKVLDDPTDGNLAAFRELLYKV